MDDVRARMLAYVMDIHGEEPAVHPWALHMLGNLLNDRVFLDFSQSSGEFMETPERTLYQIATRYFLEHSHAPTDVICADLLQAYPAAMQASGRVALAAVRTARYSAPLTEADYHHLRDVLCEWLLEMDLRRSMWLALGRFNSGHVQEGADELRQFVLGMHNATAQESTRVFAMSKRRDERWTEFCRRRDQGEFHGQFVGIEAIDQHCRGFFPGELIVWAGPPSSLKTVCLLHCLQHIWYSGGSVVYFSSDDTARTITLRLESMCTGIPVNNIEFGEMTEEEQHRYYYWFDERDQHERETGAEFYIVGPEHCYTLAQVEAELLHLSNQRAITAVAFDYVQIGTAKADTRVESVEMFVAGFKQAVTRRNAIPFVASQVKTSDFRRWDSGVDSGAWGAALGQMANYWFRLFRMGERDPRVRVRAAKTKDRVSPFSFWLMANPARMHLESLADPGITEENYRAILSRGATA